MESPEKCQVIIIDGPDGQIAAVVGRVLHRFKLARCANVYQVVAMMYKDTSRAAVIIARFDRLAAEKMRFFELVAQRPRTLCCCLPGAGAGGPDAGPAMSNVLWVPNIGGLGPAVNGKIRRFIEESAAKPADEDKLRRQPPKNRTLLSSEEIEALLGE